MEIKQFLDKTGLSTFLTQCKNIFGRKQILDDNTTARNLYLLNIDYENTLAFDTDFIVGDNNPYVGYAVVGSTYVA